MSDIRDEMNNRLLLDAGIGHSMRVLDICCGTVDVSILLAGLDGGMSEVVGMIRMHWSSVKVKNVILAIDFI